MTVTVQPRQWQLKSWRRKILVYRRLQESGLLKEHYNADSMIVATVTTSTTRLENIRTVAEKADADHRFWFTTFDDLNHTTVLTDPIWAVVGLGDEQQSLLPAESAE